MRKLGRPSDQRRALLRNIATSLVMNEKIQTTEAKAKELRGVAEKLVTFAKKGDLHSRRQAARFLLSPDAVKKLFDTYGPKYAERSGGYTRIIKLGVRRGDAAPIVLIEFV